MSWRDSSVDSRTHWCRARRRLERDSGLDGCLVSLIGNEPWSLPRLSFNTQHSRGWVKRKNCPCFWFGVSRGRTWSYVNLGVCTASHNLQTSHTLCYEFVVHWRAVLPRQPDSGWSQCFQSQEKLHKASVAQRLRVTFSFIKQSIETIIHGVKANSKHAVRLPPKACWTGVTELAPYCCLLVTPASRMNMVKVFFFPFRFCFYQ